MLDNLQRMKSQTSDDSLEILEIRKEYKKEPKFDKISLITSVDDEKERKKEYYKRRESSDRRDYKYRSRSRSRERKKR